MNVISHALVGWSLTTAMPSASRNDKAWVVAGAVASDLDGLGLVVELATRNSERPFYWWSEYHHLLAHNLLFAIVLACMAWAFTRKAAVAVAVAAMVHVHLLCDLVGARGPDGYQWPIPYLWPFSESPAFTVSWQWQLNAWPNVVFGVALLVYTLWFAWRSGASPLELLWLRGNTALVQALRSRFDPPDLPQHQRRVAKPL